MTLHAHISTASADCDGPMYRDYVMSLNEAELAESQQDENDFSDIAFRERVMCHLVHMTGGRATLVVDSEPGGWAERMACHQDTEEGYRSGEAVFCTDDCDEDEHSQRDVFAEQMGY
jgi:hypothetical protein